MGFLLNIFGGGAAKFWIAGIIIASITGYIGWLKWDIHSLQVEVAELKVEVANRDLEIERLNGQINTCNAKIEKTNEHIRDLREANETHKKSFDMLNDNIELIKAGTEREIQDIQNAPTPESCQGAMELLRDGVGGN